MEPRRVRRPQFGEVETERPGSSADDPLELGNGLALQPTLKAHGPDARIRPARDVEGHRAEASRRPRTGFPRLPFTCLIEHLWGKSGAVPEREEPWESFDQFWWWFSHRDPSW